MKSIAQIAFVFTLSGMIASTRGDPCPPANSSFSYAVGAPDRWVLIANQLNQSPNPNDINHVLALAPNCAQFAKFDNASHSLLPVSKAMNGQWYPVNYTLQPGEGGWLRLPAGASPFLISGTVVANPADRNPLTPGTFLWGRRCPGANSAPADIVDYAFVGGECAYLYLPNAGFMSFKYDELDVIWTPSVPKSAIGEAMFFVIPCSGSLLSPPVASGCDPNCVPKVLLEAAYPAGFTAPCCGHHMTYIITLVNCETAHPANKTKLKLTLPTQYVTPHYDVSFNPDRLIYASSSPGLVVGVKPNISQAPTFTFSLGQIGPYDTHAISVTVDVNNCDPQIIETLNASVQWIDEVANTFVNAYHSAQTTCSHDPNDKTVTPRGCSPGGLIPPNTDLTYVVRFQNTGTGPAVGVGIHDTLDPHLDLSTLQVLGSSHAFVLSINGRELVWTNYPLALPWTLPAVAVDEPGSHGFVAFTVKQNANLPSGTLITNQASIFFDANAPVLTEITTNTITANSVPRASFTISRANPLVDTNLDFTYTGGTPGATFAWDFGPGAVPATSTAQNPSGVIYTMPGPKLPMLKVSLGDCESEPALSLLNVGGFAPTLTAQLVDGLVWLSWTDAAYHLQATPELSASAVWTNVFGASPYYVSFGPGPLFFRLANP